MENRTLVIGLGITGLAIARYLQRKQQLFEIYDTRPDIARPKALTGHQVFLGQYPITRLKHIKRIVCSPGVALDIEVLQAAKAQNIPIESDIDCFVDEVSSPIVAITGTNGKTTVTSLVGEMANAAGVKAHVAGNIGEPVLDCLNQAEPRLWVLELSSFQLELTHRLQALASAFLNLSNDHLDRHQTMDAYQKAKQRIYLGAKLCIYNREDKATYPSHNTDESISFGLDEPQGVTDFGVRDGALVQGEKALLLTSELALKGTHNVANALAALALAHIAGLDLAPCISVLKTFKGLPHRCQVVRIKDKVTWVNDSKGTNIGSTEAAIYGLAPQVTGSLILIAGGQGKGADFTMLRDVVQQHVQKLILIGEDAGLLEKALGDVTTTEYAHSMEDAVKLASKLSKPDDLVLLSPACASFDWFDNFNHRGDVFAGLVEAL